MDFLQDYKSAFDQYLSENEFRRAPQGLYDPVNYILSLGGKRIRPLLLLMASESISGSYNDSLDAAYAVELFHNFTLLHDDIMDDAPLRRGSTTVHEKYDVNTAILSGDAMMILAYQYLAKARKLELIDIFSKMALEVCDGQQMDMEFEKREDVTISEYIEMIKLKTSVLIGAAIEMGAIIGGASPQSARHLYDFGVNIGIAFQIQDDLLDTYGTPKVGKQKCGDIIQNKKTYLYLKARENASEIEKNLIDQLYNSSPSDPTEKISKVLEVYKNTNVRGYSDELKIVYKDLAISHLVAANLKDESRLKFENFANYLLSRES